MCLLQPHSVRLTALECWRDSQLWLVVCNTSSWQFTAVCEVHLALFSGFFKGKFLIQTSGYTCSCGAHGFRAD